MTPEAKKIFYNEMRQDVQQYLANSRYAKYAFSDPRYVIKVVLICASVVATYGLLLSQSSGLVTVLVYGFLSAQALALLIFNVMHDANHQCLSNKRYINYVFGHALNVIGGSRFIWLHQHNKLHHGHTNVDAKDDDLCMFSLVRLSPLQPHRWWHRYQAYYMVPIFSSTTLYWSLFYDFYRFFSGAIGQHLLPKKSSIDTIRFLTSKALYIIVTMVVPSYFYGIANVLITFCYVHLVLGLTLAWVFQLAHIMPTSEFYSDATAIKEELAFRQVKSTANYCHANKWLTWYVGGLNYHLEHHLFPSISNIHYPKISLIVRAACKKHGLDYNHFGTLYSATSAHLRFFHGLGRLSGVAEKAALDNT